MTPSGLINLLEQFIEHRETYLPVYHVTQKQTDGKDT